MVETLGSLSSRLDTWLLAEPGSDVCAVLDPGPDDDDTPPF